MDEVVDGLLKANPFLANKPQQPIGGGTNPSGDQQVDKQRGGTVPNCSKMGYGTKALNRRLTRASFYFSQKQGGISHGINSPRRNAISTDTL
ncbi:hypothetical protein P7H12_00055 [Paenibacillus larvae]|nr:hypothetical protein [Paenibacillus larvae]MDT2262365.1 hypothetical protein [Paenibacillus larvae]